VQLLLCTFVCLNASYWVELPELQLFLSDGHADCASVCVPLCSQSLPKLKPVWCAFTLAGKAGSGKGGSKAAQQQQQLQQQALAAQQLAPLSRQQLLQLLGAKSDLALLAILASGNDYLPAVKGAPKLEQLWTRWVKWFYYVLCLLVFAAYAAAMDMCW
jgi:hypothetical protein